MVLVDTSVWIDHFRNGNIGLENLLDKGQAACHPFILGELACGTMRNRAEILTLLRRLPSARTAGEEEVLHFIERHRLMGKGLGYIDMHLLASASLSRLPLWSLDKKLDRTAAALGMRHS